MSNETATREWEALRTDESRQVEELLRRHFECADAYRYNPASLRVRVVDSRFRNLTREERYDLVEPVLDQLDEALQLDIMNVVLLHPGEERDDISAMIWNVEFEHPVKSML